MRLDVASLRQAFPILDETIHGKPLIYLDHAATSPKPRCVWEAMARYYQHDHANVHRAAHALAERATAAYEGARKRVADFINASPEEIVFVRGATEGINLVAQSFVRPRLKPGDTVVCTVLEHHANFVPWQQVTEATGARLEVVTLDAQGQLDETMLLRALERRPVLLACTHGSNVTGQRLPVESLIALAHARGVPVLVDGAQAVAHEPVDVQAMGCDFYVFSGHKMYGPTGIGVLFGRSEHLVSMAPYQTGGGMVAWVDLERTEFLEPPHRFEAGTPALAEAVGLAAAMDFIEGVGWPLIQEHERELASELATWADLPGVRVFGGQGLAPMVSLAFERAHPLDVVTLLDHYGVAVRSGHHCAMPLLAHWGVTSLLRASAGLTTTREELVVAREALVQVLHRLGEG